MPGLRGKRFAVLHYISQKYGGLAAVQLENCDLYPICKKVTTTAAGETIVYWDEESQATKEKPIVTYPVILTHYPDHTEIYFPDTHLTGFADQNDNAMAEAEKILAGWIQILLQDGKPLLQPTPISKLKLNANQKAVLISIIL